jgi:acetyl esterase/lipase
MMKKLSLFFVLVMCTQLLSAQKIMNLYTGKVPNSKIADNYIELADTSAADKKIRISKVTQPQLSAFYPEKRNGISVIICPGGGYGRLSVTNEGSEIVKALNEQGITAFVLKYRLPSDLIMEDKTIGPLQDAEQAIKMVRENAAEWGINPDKIGIMGFSAGGHLASTLGTHYQNVVIDNPKNTSLRPDFMALIYPVITMGALTHQGSKMNLLGANPTADQVKLYSNELQINAQTPPSILVHANDDKTVPSENSLDFVKALKQAGVKAELHLYQAGGHGFGLNNKTTEDKWFLSFINWLKANKWMD